MMNLRLPNISGTEAQQLAGIKDYLYQLAEQLNIALNSLEASSGGNSSAAVTNKAAAKGSKENDAQASFNDIKGLIIKSAEIVDAYYETISKKLEGLYVAESEFGTYKEDTEAVFTANSDKFEAIFSSIQSINDVIDDINDETKESKGYIVSGELYKDKDGFPVYGIKIGQTNKENGEEVFNQFACFTADRLSFYDENGIEVAYISDDRLVITQVVVKGYFAHGELEKVKDEYGKETAAEKFTGFKSTYVSGVGIVEKWEG